MKKIVLETLPTYLMVLLVAITLGLTFSVGLVSNHYIAFICLYLVVVVSTVFMFMVIVKYLKGVTTK